MPDNTSRLSTALAGRYRIVRRIGEGGMATVYLAEDIKHERQVALKLLRPELAAVLGADRFIQEIKTTANLQHPHILPLFDSGTAGGEATGRTDEDGDPDRAEYGHGMPCPYLYYVMPYIDGETLRDKLDRETQLGVDEAIKIAVEVADALDYAHRQGVIHRDIKPENILLHDGRPMVADFGIALALSAAAGGRMTETGLSLGTPHYMSPEQATAEKEITNRSDIYSIGSVLYEMLTGEPPHMGNSAQAIIMKIVTEDAQPVTKLRKSVLPNVAAAVAKSLEKLPADRFETASEFALALEDPTFLAPGAIGTTAMAVGQEAGGIRRWLYGALALDVVLLVLLLFFWMDSGPIGSTSRQQVVLWQHSVSNALSPTAPNLTNQAAIAPDGWSIVFSDSVAGGVQLLQKLRNEARPRPLAGTEGGVGPFFSPDGRWVGYFTLDGRLKKVPVDGGGSITLADGASTIYISGAWLDDGTIVYVNDDSDLRRVSDDGGESQALRPPQGFGRIDPAMLGPLPESRGVLFTGCPGNCSSGSGVYVHDLVADSTRLLVEDAAGAWYAPTGFLLYTDREGGLFAAGFDPDRMELTSGASPVIAGVAPGSFTLSASGTALYSVGMKNLASSELVWVDRDGNEEPVDPEWRGAFEYPALSPDGVTLAVSVREGETHLWIRRSNGTRQKLSAGEEGQWRPSWTGDGRSVTFISTSTTGASAAYISPADGSSPPQSLFSFSPVGVWEAEYSRDGEWLLARVDNARSGSDVVARRAGSDTSLVTLLADGSTNFQIALSPDGKWLAYSSDVSGQFEVYVASFPDMRSKYQVSQGSGTEARWAHNGRELFFKSAGMLMSVSVAPGPVFTPGAPRPLFSVAPYRDAINRQQYDVGADDRRFLMIRVPGGDDPEEVVYVENFFEELEAMTRR